MKLRSRLKSAFRTPFRKFRVDNQLDDEFREAKCGGVEQVKQPVLDHRAGARLELFWQDARFGLRQLWQNPGFTVSAIAALTLGIGANTAIFSVVNTVLLKPLTYPEADRMVNFLVPATIIANHLHNIPQFHFLERQTNLFKEVVAFDNAGPGFNLTAGHPEQVNGIHVTAGYFRVYGAPVVLGRTFTPQEDSPHDGKVVVLSYGLWQRRFGGDQTIVGELYLAGQSAVHRRRRDRKGFRR